MRNIRKQVRQKRKVPHASDRDDTEGQYRA